MADAVPAILALWVVVVVVVVLFRVLPGRTAAAVGLVGGWALLPVAPYPSAVMPDSAAGAPCTMHALALPTDLGWNRGTAVGLACLVGAVLGGWPVLRELRPAWGDLPMLAWCVVPTLSAVANNLSLAEGLGQSRYNALAWGVPYAVGRAYFADPAGLRALLVAWAVAGLAYLPACLAEFALGPFLYPAIYGPHPYLESSAGPRILATDRWSSPRTATSSACGSSPPPSPRSASGGRGRAGSWACRWPGSPRSWSARPCSASRTGRSSCWCWPPPGWSSRGGHPAGRPGPGRGGLAVAAGWSGWAWGRSGRGSATCFGAWARGRSLATRPIRGAPAPGRRASLAGPGDRRLVGRPRRDVRRPGLARALDDRLRRLGLFGLAAMAGILAWPVSRGLAIAGRLGNATGRPSSSPRPSWWRSTPAMPCSTAP